MLCLSGFWLIKNTKSLLLKEISIFGRSREENSQLFSFYLPAIALIVTMFKWITMFCFTGTYESIWPSVFKKLLLFLTNLPNSDSKWSLLSLN